ncbi:MAG: glycosyltransferase [Steroidobacteraceae bacterium]
MSSILVICFFPAFNPASSGGELRLGKLYRAVSQTHDVTLITSTDFGARLEDIQHAPRFREFRFPKDAFWRNAYATLEKSGVTGDLSGLAFALAISDPQCPLRVFAREVAAHSDYVIHEFPFSEPIFSDGCPCAEIYNSHNFEASLLSSIVRGAGFDTAILKLLRLEGNLVSRSRRVFATSRTDAEKFRLFYGASASKLGVCPNGFDEFELQPIVAARAENHSASSRRPRLLFTGSGHPPNVEAANFILHLASELPECDVVLAGGLCSVFAKDPLPSNVELYGAFDADGKFKLLREADLFLNPVVLGSGTSLKALEALGSRVAMISTEEGVRGLGLTSGVHCEIVARDQFATVVRRMLLDGNMTARMSAAGHAFVIDNFSWAHIAADFLNALDHEVSDTGIARHTVLALNDYSVMQPGSGGTARVRQLLTHIDCDVILVSFAAIFDVRFIGESLLHVTVPKTAAHREFEAALNAGQPMSANDAVASLFAAANRVLVDIISALAGRVGAVIFEHPYMAPVLDVLKAVRSALPIVYSAHNIEATHKAGILQGHSLGATLTEFIAQLEKRLTAAASLIVCCTDTDADYFAKLGANTIVVPNGCAIPRASALQHEPDRSLGVNPRIGFMGSSHGPNVEAALFIRDELARFFPAVSFELVGTVCTALPGPKPANVVFHGMVSETGKTAIMAGWDIALNPVLSGGGSSLKLPDYLAHGLATLSTPAGARSFAVVEHNAGRVATRNEFRAMLAQMLGDPARLAEERIQARLYASKHLCWDVVTLPYRQRLATLLAPGANSDSGLKLLVVTYRYTEPPLGGAEEYLIEVLKRLRPRVKRIDLAAIDTGHLTNQHHFGCQLTSMEGGTSLRVGEIFDQVRFFAPEILTKDEILTRARDLERLWCHEEFSLFMSFAKRLAGPRKLRVFAGFYHPETHNRIVRRWTSPEFSFLVPPAARTFQMVGYASESKVLRLTLMQVMPDGEIEILARCEGNITPHFRFSIVVPSSSSDLPRILSCEVGEHHAPGDHRPFGVLLDEASVLMEREDQSDLQQAKMPELDVSIADLSEIHEEELQTNHLEDWVEALRDTANCRDVAMEDNFAAVRGPHARTLQEWLEKNAINYDAVLVQGIPFDVIPRTIETLARLPKRPRLITLPHFHADDRFYYWRRYFDSFSLSDATMLFSSAIARQLGSSGKFVVVPGGGVRADERADVNAAQRFGELHRTSEPFFLVLGRKIGSKGYDRVLRAHQELRRSGVKVGLVIIGPDEDKVTVTGDGVHYLGHQPREVVRGALSGCFAVVTMSRSESFGIVVCEAWLFGKPVIANRACYSFRELVRHSKNGFLVTSDVELLEGMRQLFDQPGEAARMGIAGCSDVLQYFTWETVANSFLAVVEGRCDPFEAAKVGRSNSDVFRSMAVPSE